jgi:hypothetical protein
MSRMTTVIEFNICYLRSQCPSPRPLENEYPKNSTISTQGGNATSSILVDKFLWINKDSAIARVVGINIKAGVNLCYLAELILIKNTFKELSDCVMMDKHCRVLKMPFGLVC